MKLNRNKIILLILQYTLAYLVGIVAAVVLTPIELSLAGVSLWQQYPIMSVPGFFLFYILIPPSIFTLEDPLVLLSSVSIVIFLLGAGAHFLPSPRWRFLGRLLTGFTIGFVGAIGVYCIGIASI